MSGDREGQFPRQGTPAGISHLTQTSLHFSQLRADAFPGHKSQVGIEACIIPRI